MVSTDYCCLFQDSPSDPSGNKENKLFFSFAKSKIHWNTHLGTCWVSPFRNMDLNFGPPMLLSKWLCGGLPWYLPSCSILMQLRWIKQLYFDCQIVCRSFLILIWNTAQHWPLFLFFIVWYFNLFFSLSTPEPYYLSWKLPENPLTKQKAAIPPITKKKKNPIMHLCLYMCY